MNKVMLIGNVGKDPEVHYYEADTAVAQVSLATTERGYTLQNGTKVPDRTDWHTVVFWKSLAKTVEKYVHKGDKLYVEGKVRYRSYDDKQGKRQYVTEIWADSLEMLTPKNLSRQEPQAHESSARAEQSEEQKDNQLPF
jgi:single-strand binding protein